MPQMCPAHSRHLEYPVRGVVALEMCRGVDILKGFSTLSATVLALTFIFGNSVRQTYEAMLFLFVEHPFDVGDLLEVEKELWRVYRVELMNTVSDHAGCCPAPTATCRVDIWVLE